MKLFKQVLIRIVFLPLIFAACLAATAVTAARFIFTPENLHSIVTYQLQEILKRPVRIEGARFSAAGEIKVKGLRVTETGTEAIDLVTADYIYATYRILPLFRRKVEIDSLRFISPKITLIKRADGHWNIGDIFAGYRKTGKKSSLNRISSAEIKDGEVAIIYVASGKRYSFENFNLNVKDFKPAEDTFFDASVFFKSDAFKKPVSGRLYAEGAVNFAAFNWEAAGIKDLRAELAVLGKTARFSGGMKNFRRPEIALKAETPEVKSTELAYLFESPLKFTAPRSTWDLHIVRTGTMTFSLQTTAKPLNVKAEGTLDLSLSTPSYNFTVAAPPLSLLLIQRYCDLPFSDPSGKLTVRLRVASENGRPQVSRVVANTTWAGFRYQALSAADLNATALLSENFANSYITASDGSLALGSARLTGLKLKTDISKEELGLTYSGRLNKKQVLGKMAIVNPFTKAKTVYFTGYSKELTFSDTKKLIFDIIKLRGAPKSKPTRRSQLVWLKTLKNSIPSGYAFFRLLYKADHFSHDYMEADNFYVSAALKNISGSIEQLKGDVSIKSGRGTFFDVEATSEKDRVYYIFSMPLRLIYKWNRTGALKFGYKLKDISFNAIGSEYSMDKGRVQVKNFYMDGKEFSAHATGWIDFSNETMDLKIYTISGKYYSMGSLPEALTDASGKPALAFTLKGKMTNPDITMLSSRDAGKLIKDAAKNGPVIDFTKINNLMVGGKK